MKLAAIEQSMSEYGEYLREFREMHDMPEELFQTPDHFAVKTTGIADLHETIAAFDWDGAPPHQVHYDQVDGRTLAAVHLGHPTLVGGFEFEWLEVMEPRPGVAVAEPFVEHTEFYFPDLSLAESMLRMKGMGEFTRQANDAHATLVLPVGDGREIKINNRPLADIVATNREGSSPLQLVGGE